MEFQPLPIFLSFICLFITSYFYLKYTKSQPINHWLFLGELPSLLWNSNRLPEWLTEVFLSKDCGSFVIHGPVFSNLKYLVTCDHQNLEYILKTNFSNFPKGSEFKEIFDILGGGIFTADDSSWRLQRRMGHAVFSSGEFRSFVITKCHKMVTDQLIPFLAHVAKEGTIVDLQDVCKRIAFDCNMNLILGRDEGHLSIDLSRNEFSESMDDAQEAILYRHAMPMALWKILRWLNIGKEKKLSQTWKLTDALFGKYITLSRENLQKGEDARDMLSLYIKSPEEFCKNDKYLRDAILTMFTAGRDTIASGLMWFFYLVSRTPRVEAKLIEELKLIAKKRDSNSKWVVFDSDDLKGLVYLHAALNESLRLCPPLPLNSKSVLKEDVLPDGSVVKPGMQIILSFYSEGKMPWVWGEDSLEFKPERWIDSEGNLGHELMSKFFAFNVGPRTCIGKDISYTQMKSTVAALLFNFQIKVMEGQEICPGPFVNLLMKNGLLVKIKEREIMLQAQTLFERRRNN